MKFATKLIQHYPPHLRRVATLPREIKNSNFWPPVNYADDDDDDEIAYFTVR